MTAPRRNSKQLLADAARQEFAEFGYAGARTHRIARRAGVNKQLVFYYFGSKAGLYQAVVQDAGAAVEAVATAVPAPAAHASERLRLQLGAVFAALRQRADLTRLVVEGGTNGAGVADPIRELVHQLARTISDGQGLGYFRDDADPDLTARQGVVLLVGYLALEDAVQPDAGPESRDRWLDGVSQLLLRSLSW